MRLAPGAAALLVAASVAAPAFAQASFQHVKDSGPTPVYWDAASIKRTGEAFEIDIMQVYKPAPGKALTAGITREKLSCTWSASVGGVLGFRTIDASGKVISQSGPEPFSQGSFYGPHGWQALVVPIVCDPARIPATGLTAAQAMADAKPRLAAAATRDSDSRRAAPPPADMAPARFAPIREEQATGNMSFLDWSRVTRQGDKATVQVFDALGDDTPPPPEPQWVYSVFALRTLELDCKAQTLAQTAYVTFTKYLQPGMADGAFWPVRTARDWPLGADILAAVCSGKEPEATLPTRAAAIAHQREAHPLRK